MFVSVMIGFWYNCMYAYRICGSLIWSPVVRSNIRIGDICADFRFKLCTPGENCLNEDVGPL